MMRGPNRMKIAVRRPDGEIVSMADPVSTIYAGRLQKMPLLRGIFALIEALILGVKALMFSAKIAAESELEEEPDSPRCQPYRKPHHPSRYGSRPGAPVADHPATRFGAGRGSHSGA